MALPLLIISGVHDYEKEPTAENVQEFMTWDRDNPFSIASSLAWARENARIIREVISAENVGADELLPPVDAGRQAAGRCTKNHRSEFYAQVRRINQLVTRDRRHHHEPRRGVEFSNSGTYLERASQTARVMDVKYHTLLRRVEDVGSPVDNAQWVAILMSCSGYEPFHKKPRMMPIDPAAAVAEFLIFDEQFPCSIRRCL